MGFPNAAGSKQIPCDYVILAALMDVIVVLSACPMDITPINGEDKTPKSVHVRVS